MLGCSGCSLFLFLSSLPGFKAKHITTHKKSWKAGGGVEEVMWNRIQFDPWSFSWQASADMTLLIKFTHSFSQLVSLPLFVLFIWDQKLFSPSDILIEFVHALDQHWLGIFPFLNIFLFNYATTRPANARRFRF